MDRPKKKSVLENKYSSYKAIEGHPNYYQNSESKKIIFKKSINGSEVKISTGSVKITEAKKFAESELIRRFSSNPTAEVRKKRGVINPSIEDMWNELVDEKRPGSEPHTIENYNTSAKHGFGPFWFSKTVRDVTQANQVLFENWYIKNRGDKDYYNTRKHLRMLFNYLFRIKLIGEVPVFKDLAPIIAKKAKRKPVGRVYTDLEFTSMMTACKEVGKSPEHALRLEIYILMGRKQGRRQMEALASEWVHNNLNSKISEVWSFKNKKWREVPMSAEIWTRLKELRKLCPKDKFVFPMGTDRTRHVASQVFNGYWKEIQDIAGIEGWNVRNAARYHDLRHSFATQTVSDEWPAIVACQALDMTIKEYQRTYTHIKSGDINKYMLQSFGRGV